LCENHNVPGTKLIDSRNKCEKKTFKCKRVKFEKLCQTHLLKEQKKEISLYVSGTKKRKNDKIDTSVVCNDEEIKIKIEKIGC
jgi:hypothetical protein